MFSVQSLLWLALLLALAGSLRHVAHTFTSIDANVAWGWVQAVAVDAGLFALAIGVTQRRRVGRATLALWGGVVLFSAISIYANLAYGLAYTSALPDWVTVTRPYVLAGALPVLVLYLAEIAGGDVSYAIAEAEKERKRQERQAERERQQDVSIANVSELPDTLALARETRRRQAEQAVSHLVAFYGDNPTATQAEAGMAVARSRQWVSGQLARLEQAGVIERNGNGVVAGSSRGMAR
jgi:hypothetical protein